MSVIERRHFLIYFDNAATSFPLPEIIDQIYTDLSDPMQLGNPSSLHRLGIHSERLFSEAMSEMATTIHASQDELILTSGGTESINTALRGFVAANLRHGKHIISTKAEHFATINTLHFLAEEGYEITWLSTLDDGNPNWDELEESIRSDTTLLSLTHVNNETGAILPIDRVLSIRNKHNRNTSIHLDCIQSIGKIPFDLNKIHVELASFSGHKIHCVKGVGLLFVRNGTRLAPLIYGGGQQQGLRSGTESVWLARAFALAILKACTHVDDSFDRVLECKKILADKIISLGGSILSPDHGSPYILNAALRSIRSETLLHALEAHDIYISTLSACASRKQKTSHVLEAMGIKKDIAQNAFRISFSRFNTPEECRRVCSVLDRIMDEYALE